VDFLIAKIFGFFKSFVDAGREGERLADEAHRERQQQRKKDENT
jgi:hypothetical protein